ncbi:MAG: YdcF family protein [Lentisphaerae bacterium]|nr:YdcF family protein [Lentisphaerota bacterium]
MFAVLLNKVVGFALSPMAIGVLLALVALALGRRRHGRRAICMGVVAVVWLWVWSTTALYRSLGYGLERNYPPQRAEDMPEATAIVVLGGGMNCNTNMVYAEMWSAADRVWHAARLYRAGKAPLVVPSGYGEERHSVPLLLDLGVPREAIEVENEARNTEQNGLLTKGVLDKLLGEGERHKILLVTSAWHMRRSVLIFERAGFEVVPAATDHEATLAYVNVKELWNYFPVERCLYANSMMWKEVAGYWLYRLKYGVVQSLDKLGSRLVKVAEKKIESADIISEPVEVKEEEELGDEDMD